MGLSAKKPSISKSPAARREDRFAWAREQAGLLRSHQLQKIDAEDIAQEIDDVGSAEYYRMESALRIILLHLLKWDHQPAKRSRSWAISIRTHRRHFDRQLTKNPGLKPELAEALAAAYADAVDEAALETGLDESAFPEICGYGWDDIRNRQIVWPASKTN